MGYREDDDLEAIAVAQPDPIEGVESPEPPPPKLEERDWSDPAKVEENTRAIARHRNRVAEHARQLEIRRRNDGARKASTETGQRFRYESGVAQPVVDQDTGKPKFRPSKTPVRHSQTGDPYQVETTETGERKVIDPDRDAPIGSNPDDPEDPFIYRQRKHAPWETIDPEEGLHSPDRRIAAASAKHLHKRELEALDREAEDAKLRLADPARPAKLTDKARAEMEATASALETPEPEPAQVDGFLGFGVNHAATAKAKAEWRARETDRAARLESAKAALGADDETRSLEQRAFEFRKKKALAQREGPAGYLMRRRQERADGFKPEAFADEVAAIGDDAQLLEAEGQRVTGRIREIDDELSGGVNAARHAELVSEQMSLAGKGEALSARSGAVRERAATLEKRAADEGEKRDEAVKAARQQMREDPGFAPLADEMDALDAEESSRSHEIAALPDGPGKEAAARALQEELGTKRQAVAARYDDLADRRALMGHQLSGEKRREVLRGLAPKQRARYLEMERAWKDGKESSSHAAAEMGFAEEMDRAWFGRFLPGLVSRLASGAEVIDRVSPFGWLMSLGRRVTGRANPVHEMAESARTMAKDLEAGSQPSAGLSAFKLTDKSTWTAPRFGRWLAGSGLPVFAELGMDLGISAMTGPAAIPTFMALSGTKMAGDQFAGALEYHRANGASDEDAAAMATGEGVLMGVIGGALDRIPGGQFLTRNKAGQKVLSGALKRVLGNGAAEAVPEIGQEITSMLLEAGYRDEAKAFQGGWERIAQAGTLGFGAGATVGAFTGGKDATPQPQRPRLSPDRITAMAAEIGAYAPDGIDPSVAGIHADAARASLKLLSGTPLEALPVKERQALETPLPDGSPRFEEVGGVPIITDGQLAELGAVSPSATQVAWEDEETARLRALATEKATGEMPDEGAESGDLDEESATALAEPTDPTTAPADTLATDRSQSHPNVLRGTTVEQIVEAARSAYTQGTGKDFDAHEEAAIRLVGEALFPAIQRWQPAFERVLLRAGTLNETSSSGGAGVTHSGLEFSVADLMLRGNLEQLLEHPDRAERMVREEAAHAVAVRVLATSALQREGKDAEGVPFSYLMAVADKEAGRIWKGLPKSIAHLVEDAYSSERGEYDDGNLGHEFLRMVVEGKLAIDADGNVSDPDGVFAEGTLNPSLLGQIRRYLRDILKYFKGLADNLRRDGAPEDLVREIDSVTDEVKNRLVAIMNRPDNSADEQVVHADGKGDPAGVAGDRGQGPSQENGSEAAAPSHTTTPAPAPVSDGKDASPGNAGREPGRGSRAGTAPSEELAASQERIRALEAEIAERDALAERAAKRRDLATLRRAEEQGSKEAVLSLVPEDAKAAASTLLERVHFGAPTYVLGANRERLPASYVAAPPGAVETSHVGSDFHKNPAYGGQNTRTYHSDETEQNKVLSIAKPGALDEGGMVTDAKSAAEGPPQIVLAIFNDSAGTPVASIQTAGGNGREMGVNLSPPEDQARLADEWASRSGAFGLEGMPEGWVGYRFLGVFDLREESREREYLQLVDKLNPSQGVVQDTASRADIDAALKIPASRLTGLSLSMSPDAAQKALVGLVRDSEKIGLDRNLMAGLARNPTQAQFYMQRVLIAAAFRSKKIGEWYVSKDWTSGRATVAGLVKGATEAALLLREKGHANIADALGRTMERIVEYSEAGEKTDRAIRRAADQTEIGEDGPVINALADALARKVAFHPINKRGIKPVDSEESVAGFDSFFQDLGRAISAFDPQEASEGDIFGQTDTVADLIARAIAAHFRKSITSRAARWHIKGHRLRPGDVIEYGGKIRTVAAVEPKSPGQKIEASHWLRFADGDAVSIVGVVTHPVYERTSLSLQNQPGRSLDPRVFEAAERIRSALRVRTGLRDRREIAEILTADILRQRAESAPAPAPAPAPRPSPGRREKSPLDTYRPGTIVRIGNGPATVSAIRQTASGYWIEFEGGSGMHFTPPFSLPVLNPTLDPTRDRGRVAPALLSRGVARPRRIRQLYRKKQNEGLNRWEEQELLELEKVEGQSFMGFFEEVKKDAEFTLEQETARTIPERAEHTQLTLLSRSARGYNFRDSAVASGPEMQADEPSVIEDSPSRHRPNQWPQDFPRVFIHTNVKTLRAHPRYKEAKSGDVEAAFQVVRSLAKPHRLAELRGRFPGAIVVSVHAEEMAGRNQIPLALAEAIADDDLEVDVEIVQRNRTFHTDASAATRFLERPEFDGEVRAGARYIIVDDVTTSGSTLAALRDYIEAGGGTVVAASTLATTSTASTGYGGQLAMLPETRAKLVEKFDANELSELLSSYGFPSPDSLTNSQARYLTGFKDVDSIRNRLAAQGQERVPGEDSGLTPEVKSGDLEELDRHLDRHIAVEQLELFLERPDVPPERTREQAARWASILSHASREPYRTKEQLTLDFSAPAQILAQIPDPADEPKHVTPEEYDELVARGFKGDWEALGKAVAMRGKASSILADMVDEERDKAAWNIVGTRIDSAEDFAAALLPIRSPYRESLKVAVLDDSGKVVWQEVVTIGSINESIAHPRELFAGLARIRAATGKNYTQVIFGHNHPSGDPSPSEADLRLTMRLEEIAKSAGFNVMDHVITNGHRYYSFREAGRIAGSQKIGPSARSRQFKPGAQWKDRPERAQWEAVPREDLKKVEGPEDVRRIAAGLRKGDPATGHIFYMSTRHHLLAVEELPGMPAMSRTELARRVMEGAALNGAYAIIVNLPDGGSTTENVRRMRGMSEFAQLVQVPMLDAVSFDGGSMFSGKESGILEEPAAYSIGSRSSAKNENTPNATPLELFHSRLDHAIRIADAFPLQDKADARQMARIALRDAARNFDPKIGVPFDTYSDRAIANRLRSAIRHAQRRTGLQVDPPETLGARKAGESPGPDGSDPSNPSDEVEQVLRDLERRGVINLDHAATRQKQAAAEENSGKPKKIGRPDLAFGADNPDVRGTDQHYTDHFRPQKEKAWRAEADDLLTRDYEGTRRAIELAGLTGETISPAQTKAAAIIARDLRHAMLRTGDPADRRAFNVFWYAYRGTGTAAGRELASRHDPDLSPAERHREFLLEVMLKPRKPAQEKIDAAPAQAEVDARIADLERQLELARAEGDAAKAETIKEIARRIEAEKRIPTKEQLIDEETRALIEKLKRSGISVEDVLKDRVEVRLASANIVKEFAKGLTKTQAQAFRLMQKGKSVSDISGATGLTEDKVRALRKAFEDRMRHQHFGKFKAGAKADQADALTGLFSKAAKAAKTSKSLWGEPASDSQAEAEFAKWLSQMIPEETRGKKKHFDITDPAHVIRVARVAQAATRSDAWDMIYEYWIMNILSGPQTQVANIAGNLGYGAVELTLQRGMEALVNLFVRDSRAARLGEFRWMAKGLIPGLAKAFASGAKAWSAEHDFFEHEFAGTPLELESFDKGGTVRAAIPGKLGRVIRIPGRGLLFADSFFKTAVGHVEAAAQAYRMARAEELSGRKLAARVEMLSMTRAAAIARHLSQANPQEEAAEYFASKIVPKANPDAEPGDPDSPAARKAAVVAMVADKTSEAWAMAHEQAAYDLAVKSGWSPEAWERAVEKAKEVTFQQPIRTSEEGGNPVENVAVAIQEMRSRSKLISFFFPFVRTPFNIFRAGLRKSPLGSASLAYHLAKGLYGVKDGKKYLDTHPQAVRDLAEQLIAWAAFALIYGAAQGDDDDEDKPLLITGSMPYGVESRGKRELQARAYGGDYVLRAGGRDGVHIAFGRFEPFATVLGTTVDAIRAVKNHGAPADRLDALWGYFVAQAQSKTFLQGFAEIGRSLQNAPGQGERVKRMVLQALVPNLIRQPIRNLDDYARDTRTAGPEYHLFPAGDLAQPKISVYGEPVEKSANPVVRLFVSTALATNPTLELADRALLRWNSQHPAESYAPDLPGRTYRRAGKDVEMSAEEYRKFSENAGRLAVTKLRGSLVAAEAERPTEETVKKIREAFTDARAEARRRMFGEPSVADIAAENPSY